MRKILGGFVAVLAVAAIGVVLSDRAVTADQQVNGGAAGTSMSSDIEVQTHFAPGTPKVFAWAVIARDGTTVRGEKIFDSTKLGTGQYEVRIAAGSPPVLKNVRNCAYTATIGDIDHVSAESPGEITTVGRSLEPAGVFISTHDSAGTFADRSFHLLVTC